MPIEAAAVGVEQVTEVLVVAGFQALLEQLLAGIAQALQVRCFQHAHSIGTMFFHAPAELLFHHETVKQHDIRGQIGDKRVETAVVELDCLLGNAQAGQVGLVLALAGRAAEGDVPALCKKALENLHHVPAGGRGARFGPDITDDKHLERVLLHASES
ncbi:hypothetical protein D9M71_224720 [compost metagenome]